MRIISLSFFLLFTFCSPVVAPEKSLKPPAVDTQKVSRKETKEKLQDPQVEPKKNDDPCKAGAAQEAFALLSLKRPANTDLINSETYYEIDKEKILGVSQLRRKHYMQDSGYFIEMSVAIGERGSKIEAYNQVVSTKEVFIPAAGVFLELTPFWQAKVSNQTPYLFSEHFLFSGDKKGFLRYENDTVVELGYRYSDGTQLLCRSDSKCKCF